MRNIRINAPSLLVGVALNSGVLTLTAEQAEILSHQSIVYLDDGQGGTAKTLRNSGINVQVVNGMGSTTTTNGTGNLIVGYNELGNTAGDVAGRTTSSVDERTRIPLGADS